MIIGGQSDSQHVNFLHWPVSNFKSCLLLSFRLPDPPEVPSYQLVTGAPLAPIGVNSPHVSVNTKLTRPGLRNFSNTASAPSSLTLNCYYYSEKCIQYLVMLLVEYWYKLALCLVSAWLESFLLFFSRKSDDREDCWVWDWGLNFPNTLNKRRKISLKFSVP